MKKAAVPLISIIIGLIVAIITGLLAWFGMFFVNPPEHA